MDVSDPRPALTPAVRAEALEQLLVERHLVDPKALDQVIADYQTRVGPLNGAKVVAKAWTDPRYKQRLLSNGSAAVDELDLPGRRAEHLVVVENTPRTHNVIVCTLCSCYPWQVLGLPPAWYKDPAYRARVVRQPRAVLAEMGLTLADDVLIIVRDSSAEVRWMVLPERPAGTDDLSESELVPLITREAMIGVGKVELP